VLRQIECAIFFVSLSSSLMFADQIVLKNGDRLTGTVVKSDGKILVLHTEFAGDVTVKYEAITQIATDEQLHVGLKNGQTVVGPMTTSDGKIKVATKAGGTVEAPKEDVAIIRNDAEQTAYDKSLHPGLLHGWNGGANLGFALARGNNQTENLAIAFNAVHPTRNDKITMYASTVYAKNDAPGASPSTVADLVQGGIRYDRDQTTLDLLGGINYTRESYATTISGIVITPAFTREFAALTLGEEFSHKVGASTVVVQKLYFYPDLSDTGQYRGTFDLGTVTKISKWLGWQNQFGDIYVTNPPAGKKQNDVVFTTGLNISFTPSK
jgi:hypothetical protein